MASQTSDALAPTQEQQELLLPLFDATFYSAQRGMEFGSPSLALADYMATGWRSGLRASRFFDERFYLASNPDLQNGDLAPPLEHYLRHGANEGRQPHPFFSWRKYRSRHPDRSWASLADYFDEPVERRKNSSAFFSARWYKIQEPELDESKDDLLEHYITVGAARGNSPFPSMDPEYYAKNWMTEGERRSMTVLEHFERQATPRPKTFALFDKDFYLRIHQDLGEGTCPSSHFASHGVWERRAFSAFYSEKYIQGLFPSLTFADRPPIGEYLRQGLGRRKRIIFVGHEGSRTGAPGILLKLVQQVSAFRDVECFSIIDQPGPLVEEHARFSHTITPEVHRLHVYHHGVGLERFERQLHDLVAMADEPPVAVICNSAESRLYGVVFSALQVPVITLMHEIATFYPESQLRLVQETSDLLVFPAEFVARAMRLKAPDKRVKTAVIPQGVLRETYGLRPGGDRAVVFGPHGGVGEDEILVTGCGTIDGRKGFDLFVEVARLVRQRAPDRKVRFAWVGGRRDWRINEGAFWDTAGYWAHWDMLTENLVDEIRVIGEVPDTEPFLVNSDIFLMSSRADPFPCVVHEAMACGLPIVSFENAGGAPEAFLPDAGEVVPYHDTSAMADVVIRLAGDRGAREALGARGRQIVAERYRFEDYTHRLMNEAERLNGLAPGSLGSFQRKASRGRIYFTVPLWTVSGVNTMTEFLVNDLNAQGFEAEILITGGHWAQPRTGRGDFYDVKTEYMPSAATRVLHPASLSEDDRMRELENFLNRNAPCVLVPGFDYVASAVARRLSGTVGVVGVIHADDREHYSHAQRLGHLWNRTVAVSATTHRELLRLIPSMEGRTEVIRYGLPEPSGEAFTAAMEAKARSGDPIRLVYAGRFETFQKRIGDYPKVARALSALGVPYELTMVGEGSQESAIAAAAADEIASGRVRLPGRLSQKETAETFLPAHVVLVLSDFEGLPLSLIEGLQRGCIPIVYEMKSGIPEVIQDGHNGFIVPRGDIAAAADRIDRLQRDPGLRARMMKAALETSRAQQLTLEDMGGAYGRLFAEVFEELAAGDRPRQARRAQLEPVG